MRRALPLIAALALVSLPACSQNSDKPADTKPADAHFVTTTTPLGDVVKNITACGGGSVEALMPLGADPHEFSPASNQVATMTKAKLVIANGLDLEAGFKKALNSVKTDGGKVYEVGPDVDPMPFEEHKAVNKDPNAKPEEGHEEEHFDKDPHVWLDAKKMSVAAEKIGAKMAEASGNVRYTECGKETAKKLATLDAELATKVESLPKDKRVMVTDHAAFNYFAKRYGFTIVGVVIPGGSTKAEPSSKEIAGLAATVKDKKVPAIFTNVSSNAKLEKQVADAAGIPVAMVPLFVESLGDKGSGAETYETMMKTNVDRIVQGLSKK